MPPPRATKYDRFDSRQPKAMPTSSSGSNFLTMPRYRSTKAIRIMIRFFQPPSMKKAEKPDSDHSL